MTSTLAPRTSGTCAKFGTLPEVDCPHPAIASADTAVPTPMASFAAPIMDRKGSRASARCGIPGRKQLSERHGVETGTKAGEQGDASRHGG